jgi:hypothetical protein
MPETVTYAGSAAATGGPSVGFTVALAVEGYGKSTTVITKKTKKTVALNTPGTTVALFVIKSSKYDDQVTVKGAGPAVPLNAPLIVGGAGIASALVGAATGFEFDNQLNEDITVEVFVARKA